MLRTPPPLNYAYHLTFQERADVSPTDETLKNIILGSKAPLELHAGAM